jgi:hypothetical protein
MEPFSLAILVVAFLKSFASSAGSEVGKAAGAKLGELVFPKIAGTSEEQAVSSVAQGQATPEQEQVAQTAVASAIAQDPALGTEIQTTINQAVAADPGLADLLPSAAQALFGLSDAQRAVQRDRCPVGGEHLWGRVSYFDGQGQPLSRFQSFSSYPRSAWGQCRQGHRWAVFAAGGQVKMGLLSRLFGR